MQIRHILANGSLHFPPFSGENFRQDVHWSSYKCMAVNTVGTIVSRDVSVRAGEWRDRGRGVIETYFEGFAVTKRGRDTFTVPWMGFSVWWGTGATSRALKGNFTCVDGLKVPPKLLKRIFKPFQKLFMKFLWRRRAQDTFKPFWRVLLGRTGVGVLLKASRRQCNVIKGQQSFWKQLGHILTPPQPLQKLSKEFQEALRA